MVSVYGQHYPDFWPLILDQPKAEQMERKTPRPHGNGHQALASPPLRARELTPETHVSAAEMPARPLHTAAPRPNVTSSTLLFLSRFPAETPPDTSIATPQPCNGRLCGALRSYPAGSYHVGPLSLIHISHTHCTQRTGHKNSISSNSSAKCGTAKHGPSLFEPRTAASIYR